jgi:hypothetical protein
MIRLNFFFLKVRKKRRKREEKEKKRKKKREVEKEIGQVNRIFRILLFVQNCLHLVRHINIFQNM